MGGGASVRAASRTLLHSPQAQAAVTASQRVLRLAAARLVQAVQRAEQLQAVANERAERLVLVRVRRATAHAEAASKRWFVHRVSTTSAAAAFAFDLRDVRQVSISKRRFEVYNCGPELRDVPTLTRAAAAATKPLELRDPQLLEFLLTACLWAAWKPPTSWRMKADQTFDFTVHVRSRHGGFLTGGERLVRLRVGRKWLGAQHHNADAGFGHDVKSQWLHRVDYGPEGGSSTGEGEFYRTVAMAWDKYLQELAKLPTEDLRAGDDAEGGFQVDAQDRHTHLRIKYLLVTSLERILSDKGTYFRVAHQYELWRMAQEDAERHRDSDSREDHFAGPLLDAHIDELTQLFEAHAMEREDVTSAALVQETDAARPAVEDEPVVISTPETA
ncbi:hypothetical protein PybrP1_010374 [[Pythium] brassicae (nom. inval.)]|nr:hypothetical protein PybrP1_010374 [[Pythium] brassicae (nom. inval.)]